MVVAWVVERVKATWPLTTRGSVTVTFAVGVICTPPTTIGWPPPPPPPPLPLMLTVALPLIGPMLAVTVSLPALVPVTSPVVLMVECVLVLFHIGLTHAPVEESL